MKEQPQVQAARLEIREGRLRVELIPDGGVGSSEVSDKWGCLYAVSHVISRVGSAERLLERVEGVAQESYRRSPGGVTNRLRQAVRNANRYLYLRNCVRGEEQAVLAALACVAVRGADAYFCGVGPHSILVISRGRVRGLGASASAVDEDNSNGWRGNGHLLGRSAKLTDPKFVYRQVMPGDQLLVVAGDSAECFTWAADQLRGALREQHIGVAAEALGEMVKKEADGAGLLLRLQDNHTPFSQQALETRTDRAPSLFGGILSSFRDRAERARPLEYQPPATSGTVERGRSELVRGGPVDRRAKIGRRRPDVASRNTSRSGAGAASATRIVDEGLKRCRLGGMLLLSLLLALRGAALGVLYAVVGGTRSLWGWIREHRLVEHLARGGQLALVGLWAGLKGLLVGMLPERERSTRTYAATARPMARAKVLGFHPSGRSRAVIGGLIVLVVFALIGTSAVRVRTRLQQADVERLADEVAARLALADQQQDRASAMVALEEAEGLLSQVTDSQRESPALVQVSQELEARWDALTGVVRLPLSAEMAAQASEAGVGGLIVHQDHAYVLDSTGQGVSCYHLDQEGHVLPEEKAWTWQLPEAMKKDPDTRILDMEWVDAANGRLTPAAVMLTSDGSVLEMTVDGSVRAVEVADQAKWQTPRALATYDGNLYVLDAGYGNILKYVPYGDDYQHAPTDYIQSPVDIDWSQVVDMAIDGYVYLLLSDGSVMKFVGGQRQAFPQEGLYPPLANPAGIFAKPDHQSVLVADPQEGRLVEFTREGRFVRQYRVPLDGEEHLEELRAFAVEVSRNRLMVGTPSGLFSASLPALQQQESH